MGLLSFLRKENQDFEKEMYKSLLIKELMSKIDDLKEDVKTLKEEFKTLKESQVHNRTQPNPKPFSNKLTKSEKKMYQIFKDKKPKTIEEFSELTGFKVESLRVYCSRIRRKGNELEFED